MTNEEMRDVLRKAKGVLLERGWRNDGSYGPDCGEGPVCLVGALGVAIKGNPFALASSPREPILSRLAQFCPPEPAITNRPEWTVLNFNDDYASFEDVIDLIDQALASLEPSKTPELVA